MKLSAPSVSVFVLSALLAIAVIGGKYLGLTMPVVSPAIGAAHFETMVAAYLMLAFGALFSGV